MQIDVTFACDDGHAMRGVLTMPDATAGARRPALLMLYELLGMNDEMRRVARVLADEGYVVLIPDFLDRGVRPMCIAKALHAVSRGEGQPVDDIEAARRWLAARPEVDPERMGVIGFCIGGGFALLLAMTGKYMVAAPFYGEAPAAMPRSCPVVASYGGRDQVFGRAADRLEKNLQALGVRHDVKLYPDAGHSFYTHTPRGVLAYLGRVGPLRVGHNEEAARDAHRRVLAFFAEHLDPTAKDRQSAEVT